MTVEEAIKGWYEFKCGGRVVGYKPPGYGSFKSTGNEAHSPWVLHWEIVKAAFDRMHEDGLGEAYTLILLSGGDRQTLLDAAERSRIELRKAIQDLMANEFAERIENSEKKVGAA